MNAFFGHHKCGSTWIWELLERVTREIGLRHYTALDELTPTEKGPLLAYVSGDGGEEARKPRFDRRRLRERAFAAKAGFVSCMTAEPEQLGVLAPARAFHVIRDPRDIIVSGYFSHLNERPADHPGAGAWSLPHIANHRRQLQRVSKDEGLLLEMDFARCELLELREWDYDRPDVLEVRLEDLAAAPYDGFLRIFRHLQLLADDEPSRGGELMAVWLRRTLNRLSHRPRLERLRRPMIANGEVLLGSVYAHRFEAKTKGRSAGTEDTSSHYRKGVAGDWANHFTAAHLTAFNERFDGLIEKLGYENSLERVAHAGAPAVAQGG